MQDVEIPGAAGRSAAAGRGAAGSDTATEAGGTRRRILDVAASQFRAHGYAGVGLRRIAQAADLRTASLYHHFSSKDDLVAAVLDEGITAVLEAVERALAALPAETPACARVRTAIVAHLESLLAQSDYTSANVRIFGQLPAEVQDRHKPVRHAYEAVWDRLLTQAREAGELRADIDPVLLRNAILGTLNATLEWFRPERGSIAALADQHARLLLTGCLDPEARGRTIDGEGDGP